MCFKPRRHFEFVVDKLEITPLQKDIIKDRYIILVEDTRTRAMRISIVYHVSHLIVTVGSLIVPALMSIQYMTTQNEIYWITWVLSLLVTTSNGLLTFFKIDKKYLYLHTDVEKLITEGWQYSQLSGRYSGFTTPGKLATHSNQFIFFCHTIEKIRMKEIDEEYNRRQEQNAQTGAPTTQEPIVPVTPMNPLQNNVSRLKSILEEAEIDSSPIVDGSIQKGQVSVSVRETPKSE
jgi:hypothetical protein